ncbi:MAG: PorV/PorQ family protein [Bacteroidota bacterium]
MKTQSKQLLTLMAFLLPMLLLAQIDGRGYLPDRDQGNLEFLSVDIAPQNAGIAGAGVANPQGGFLQNSALLIQQSDRFRASLQYSPWLRALGIPDFHYGYASFAWKIDEQQAIGFTYQQFSSFWREFFFQPINPFHQMGARFHYARRQQHISWGVSAAYIEAGHDYRGGLQKSRGLSLSAGLNAHYQFWGANWDFAMSLSDLGPRQSVTPDFVGSTEQFLYLPTTLRLGGRTALQLTQAKLFIHYQLEHLLLPRDLTEINSGWLAPFQSIQDAPRGENWQEWQYKLGLEWAEIGLAERFSLSLRLGWWYEHPDQGGRHLATTGFSLHHQQLSLSASYWYGLQPNLPLQNTMTVGLSYGFGQ